MIKNIKLLLIVLLCVQILPFSFLKTDAKINENKMTYKEFLSNEIEVKTDYYIKSYYFDSNKNDNNYFYKYNVDTKETTKILNEVVVSYYSHNDNIYCVLDNNSIIRITINGENETLLYQGENEITNLYADDNALYFKMNNAIYRYFINEKILDELVYHEQLYSFMPLSNHVIDWCYFSNEWLKYVEETGDITNEKDEFASQVTHTMRYNDVTKENTAIDDWYIYRPKYDEIPTFAVNTTASLTFETSSSLPLAEYPDGSYFSNKSTGCTCHGTSECNLYSDIACDCLKSYNADGRAAIQNHGFACFVYRAMWGSFSENAPFNHVKKLAGKDISNEDIAKLSIKNYIESNLGGASLIRFKGRTGGFHTIIIASIDAKNNRIIAYHANVGEPCKVAYEWISYAELAEDYSSIEYAYKGGR